MGILRKLVFMGCRFLCFLGFRIVGKASFSIVALSYKFHDSTSKVSSRKVYTSLFHLKLVLKVNPLGT